MTSRFCNDILYVLRQPNYLDARETRHRRQADSHSDSASTEKPARFPEDLKNSTTPPRLPPHFEELRQPAKLG